MGNVQEPIALRILEILADCYVKLNQLNASPGDRAHMLAKSIQWCERHMREVIQRIA